eukprot:gene17123-23426_t
MCQSGSQPELASQSMEYPSRSARQIAAGLKDSYAPPCSPSSLLVPPLLLILEFDESPDWTLMDRLIEVTYEDQRNINAFSKFNAKMHDLEAQIVARKKVLEGLEDADNELMLYEEEYAQIVARKKVLEDLEDTENELMLCDEEYAQIVAQKKVLEDLEDAVNVLVLCDEESAQIVARKKVLEDLEDAENELMLCDEESVRFCIGECFVHVDSEAAEERLQDMSNDCKVEVEKCNTKIAAIKEKLGELKKVEVEKCNKEIAAIKEKLGELKKVLYAKFGNSINLEEEPTA